MQMHKVLFIVLSIVSLISSCQDEEFTPKPRGYANINLPKHSYTNLPLSNFPYMFELPLYGKVMRDTTFFGDKTENPYWLNIDFGKLGGKIYLTYKKLNSKVELQKLLEDNYKMSYAHSKKADFIDDAVFSTPHNVSGILSHVGGNAASSYQFFATDSTKHFLRGALYFDAVPNEDSLQPVTEFLKKDLEHLIQTLRWQN
jgi:gliding motility-associated lipoprotein GldD